MRTTLLFPILCVLFLAAACSKEADNSPAPLPVPQEGCFVQEEKTITAEDTVTIRYSYDERYRISGTAHFRNGAQEYAMVYTYDAKDRVAKEQLLTPAGEFTETTVFAYTTGDKMSKYTVYREFPEQLLVPVRALTCQYNKDNQLSATTEYNYRNNKATYVTSTKYTYSNQVMARAEVLDKNRKVSETLTLSYDGLKTPLSAASAHQAKTVTVGFPHAQNIDTCRVENSLGELVTGSSFTSAYTYSAAGYPTEVLTTYSDGKTKRTTYTYKCL